MSVYAGPEIVNPGLVLHLDTGNIRSYPGSGTTWNDLSTNARTGTLTNGPTFSSSNGGSIVFDGVNDFIEFGDVLDLGTNDMTINVWVRPTTLTAATYYAVFGKGRADVQDYRWVVGFYGSSPYALLVGASNSVTEHFSSSSLSINTWYMLTYIYNRSSNVTMYVNGAITSLSSGGTISNFNGQNFQSSNPLRVAAFTAADNVGMTSPFPGNISVVQIYLRSLSAAEVRQNFNALRGRFNI